MYLQPECNAELYQCIKPKVNSFVQFGLLRESHNKDILTIYNQVNKNFSKP